MKIKNHMFNKVIKWAKNTIFNQSQIRRDEAFEIQHHNIVIEGQSYFLAQATNFDIPEILAVEKAVYHGKTPWDRLAFVHEFRRKSDRFYMVVRHEDQMIGFIGASFNDEKKQSHITNVAIIPEYQKRGVGSFLIQAILNKSKYINYQATTLEVRKDNEQAQKLYKKLGFQEIGIKKSYYFGDHEDAISMSLDLSNWKGGYLGTK